MTSVGHGIVTRVSQGILHIFKCCRLSRCSSYRLMRRWLSESSMVLEIMKNVALYGVRVELGV